jgi:hypothetical protein
MTLRLDPADPDTQRILALGHPLWSPPILPHRGCRCEWDGQLVSAVHPDCPDHKHLRGKRPAVKVR